MDVRHQLRTHIEALRAAGIDWVSVSAVPAGDGAASASVPSEEPSSSDLFAPAATASLTTDKKLAALKMLNDKEVIGCTRCDVLVKNRKQTVFGVGNVDAELCFIGEAPGADEDVQGEPFVGAAGQLLNKIIVACKMQRGDVYICNILKCRPPGNRTPLPDEVANCSSYLERQLDTIRPKYICALGACAAQSLLKTTASIGKLRGKFHDYRGIPVLATYHPAYLLRNPAAKKDVWDDMKLLMRKMGRPVD
jgi:uracil-DNA glycosylase family 4